MTAPDPTKPWAGYVQDQEYSAFQDRMIQIGKVNHQATVSGLNTRNGVFLGGGDGNSNINLNVRSNGGMNLLIDAGSAIIDGYSVINPIQQAMTVDPSTSTARRDAVILRVYDTEAGDVASTTMLEIVKGANTSDPPLPARSLLLAVVDVPANAVSVNPQDRRQFTTSVGGVVPYYGSRPDITTIANGQIVHSLTTGQNDQRDGDTYHPLGPVLVSQETYSYTTHEQVDLGVYAYKPWTHSVPRDAGIVQIMASFNFQSLGPTHATIVTVGIDWDGAKISEIQVDTNGHVDTAVTLTGIVSRPLAGNHSFQPHIRPTAGESIQLSLWNAQVMVLG